VRRVQSHSGRGRPREDRTLGPAHDGSFHFEPCLASRDDVVLLHEELELARTGVNPWSCSGVVLLTAH
jgi:hypothetical protein